MKGQRKPITGILLVLALAAAGAVSSVSAQATVRSVDFSNQRNPDKVVMRFRTTARIQYFDVQQGPGKIKLVLYNAQMAGNATRGNPADPVRLYTIQRLRDRVVFRLDMDESVPVVASVRQDRTTSDFILDMTFANAPNTQRISNPPPDQGPVTILDRLEERSRTPIPANRPVPVTTPSRTTGGTTGVTIAEEVRYGNPSSTVYPGTTTTRPASNYDTLEQWEIDSPIELDGLIREAEVLAEQIRVAPARDKAVLERSLDAKLHQIFESEQAIRARQIERNRTALELEREQYGIRARDRSAIQGFRKDYLLNESIDSFEKRSRFALYWGRAGSRPRVKSGSEDTVVVARPSANNPVFRTAPRRSDW